MTTIAEELKKELQKADNYKEIRDKAIVTINEFKSRYPDKTLTPYINEQGYYKLTINPEEWKDESEKQYVITGMSFLCELFEVT